MVTNTAILETLIPKDEWKPFDKGQEEEYLQPLMDLGYLAIDQTKNQFEIQNAIRVFRQEYQQLGWMLEEMDLPQPNVLMSNRALDELEIKLLHLLVDMDGDFEINLLPVDDEQSIISRVIYFRLRLLGLYENKAIDISFTKLKVEELFAPLRKWLALSGELLALINLSGNVPELIRAAWQLGGLDKQVVCFKYKPMTLFQPDFKKVVAAEKQSDVQQENQKLETIETELKSIAPAKDKARMKKVLSSKILRRQSKAEQLRAQIVAILEVMKLDLDEQLEQNSQLATQIKILNESITKKIQERTHFQENIKELKRQKKQVPNLQKEILKIQAEKKKIKTQLDSQIDYVQQLAVQQSILKQLLEKQLETPADLAKKFKAPIQSAQGKIKKLMAKVALLQRMDAIDERLQAIVHILSVYVDPTPEIEKQKQRVDRLGSELSQLKKQLENRSREKEKEDLEFAESQAKAQEDIRHKKERYDDLLQQLLKIPRRFRRELEEYLDPDFYKKVGKELLDRTHSPFFDQQLIDPYNQFLIRLIQLHQWTNGYYNGVLDSDLGELTFNSIREIDEDVRALKLRFVLYQIDPVKGTWLLNVRYFFDEMIASLDEFKEQANFESVVGHFEKEINENPKIRSKKKEFDKQWKSAIKETQKDLKNNLIRRVYFGIRSIARSIVRGIKRLIGLIFSGLKKLFRLLRNFVLMVYREIRDGLKKFAQGIGFLFGKRTITTKSLDGEIVLSTRYDFDCDVITLAHPTSKAMVKQHVAKNYEIVQNLDFALVLTGKVINYVLKFAIFGYAMIFIRIALYFKKLVKKFLMKKVLGAGVKLLL